MGNFDFDPEEFLEMSLLFDLKQTSEEQIFDAILEKIPDNDKYYTGYKRVLNKNKKDTIITVVVDLDKKLIKPPINQNFLS